MRTCGRFDGLDCLLLMSIVGLSVFLLIETIPPLFGMWLNRPRSGMQVQQYSRVQVRHEDGKVRSDATETPASATVVSYLLYLPKAYAKDTDRRWPLLLYLHGSGQRGNDLNRVRMASLPRLLDNGPLSDCPHIHEQFVVVSPQCPADSSWIPGVIAALTSKMIDQYRIDPDRVYLTGFSMGGSGTWNTACHYPDLFAAIVPLAGGGDAAHATGMKNMPIWAFHGAKDGSVPLTAGRAMVEAVENAGGHVRFTVYPDSSHGIADETYRNPLLYQWLLIQQRH